MMDEWRLAGEEFFWDLCAGSLYCVNVAKVELHPAASLSLNSPK